MVDKVSDIYEEDFVEEDIQATESVKEDNVYDEDSFIDESINLDKVEVVTDKLNMTIEKGSYHQKDDNY